MSDHQFHVSEVQRIPALLSYARYLKANFYLLVTAILPLHKREQLELLARKIQHHPDLDRAEANRAKFAQGRP